MGDGAAADGLGAEALFVFGGRVLIAGRAALRAGDVHADRVGLPRLQRDAGLGVELHVPVVPGGGDQGRGAAAVAGHARIRAVVGLQGKGVFRGAAGGDHRVGKAGQLHRQIVLHALPDPDIADGHRAAGGDVADLQQDLQRAALRRRDGMGDGAAADGLGAEALFFSGGRVLIAGRAALRAGDVHADRVGLPRLQLDAGLGVELHVPVVPGGGDGGRGAAAVAGQARLRAAVGLQVEGIVCRDVDARFGIGKAGHFDLDLCSAAELAQPDIADRDRIRRGGAAELEDQHQFPASGGRRPELGGVFAGAVQAPLSAVEFFGAAVLIKDLKLARVGRRADRRAEAIPRPGFRRHAGFDEELRAPDAALAARGADVQHGRRAGDRQGLLEAVIVFFPYIAFAAGAERDLAHLLILRRQRLDAEIRQRYGVAGGGIRLAHLQTERQGPVAHVRRDDQFHVIRAARRQTAGIQSPVGVFIIAVKAGLVLGLAALRSEIEGDAVAGPGLRRHAGDGIEPDLPHPALGRVRGGLRDLQRRAGGSFLQFHRVSVVMSFVNRIRSVVGKVRQRDLLVGFGNHPVQDPAGGHRGIQREAGRKHIGISIGEGLHPEIADRDAGARGRFAERELQHKLAAPVGAGDHGFAGFRFARGQALAVEGAVALLLAAVIQEEFKGQVPVAADVRRNVIARAGLGDQAGLDEEPGFPNPGLRGNRPVVDADRVRLALEDRVIVLVVRLIYGRLPRKVHGSGQRVFIIDHVRVFLYLDLRKIDRKGREHAQLQVKIARAAGGDQDAGNAVVALSDGKLLEIAELDLAGHIRAEAIGHPVIPAGNGGIVALKLDMPGLAVCFRGGEAVHAVDGLAAARDGVALEFRVKQVALPAVLPGRSAVSRQRHKDRPVYLPFRSRGRGRRVLPRGGRDGLRRVRRGRLFRLCRPSGRHGAAGKQQRRQKNNCRYELHALHHRFLLALRPVRWENRGGQAVNDCAECKVLCKAIIGHRTRNVNCFYAFCRYFPGLFSGFFYFPTVLAFVVYILQTRRRQRIVRSAADAAPGVFIGRKETSGGSGDRLPAPEPDRTDKNRRDRQRARRFCILFRR